MQSVTKRQRSACTPALIAGTSSEFLGRKPLPRLVRQRSVIVVIGADGVGKSSVARHLAGRGHLALDTRQLELEIMSCVRTGAWAPQLLQAPGLVLDGPVWLRNRPGVVRLLRRLACDRARVRRKTLICQSDHDGSVDELISVMEAGSLVVLGLRFPKGRRSRIRFARKMCEEMGIPVHHADGSDKLEPWRYESVVTLLRERSGVP